jgi:hypothetical protein
MTVDDQADGAERLAAGEVGGSSRGPDHVRPSITRDSIQ